MSCCFQTDTSSKTNVIQYIHVSKDTQRRIGEGEILRNNKRMDGWMDGKEGKISNNKKKEEGREETVKSFKKRNE